MNRLINECESRFADLSESWGNGDLTEAQFNELTDGLRVRDSAGTQWRLSPRNGNWTRWDGAKWIEDGKPADAVEPAGEHPARKNMDELLPAPPEEVPPKGVKARLGQVCRYLLGAVLLTFGAGRPLLGLVGPQASGVVTNISRTVSIEDERNDDISISYDFTLPDGRTISGLSTKSTKRFGQIGIAEGQPLVVRYVPGMPQLNVASWDAKYSLGNILIGAVGFLILAPSRWLRRKRQKR